MSANAFLFQTNMNLPVGKQYKPSFNQNETFFYNQIDESPNLE